MIPSPSKRTGLNGVGLARIEHKSPTWTNETRDAYLSPKRRINGMIRFHLIATAYHPNNIYENH